MKINTQLDLVNYGVIVETIVGGYFDSDDKFDPHIGRLNAMRVFWNCCVYESELDSKYSHNIFNIMDMQEIVTNEDFIQAFNSSLVIDMVRLDFANAYADAMQIVDNRQRENEISDLAKAIQELAEITKPFANAMESRKNLQNMSGAFSPGSLLPLVQNLEQAFKDMEQTNNVKR